MLLVGSMLLITAVLLMLADRAKDTTKKVGIKESVIIGVSQAIAILPGISRGAKDAVEQIVKSQQQNLIDYNNDVFKHMEQLEYYVSIRKTQLQAPEGSSRVVSNSSVGEPGQMGPRDANFDAITEDFGPPGTFSPGSPFRSIHKAGIREQTINEEVSKRE